jgi:phosphate uptake regulator
MYLMEVRKLQLIGGSSYMVSVPKDWVRSNKLKQGDEILLQVEDSVITLYPRKFMDEVRITKVEIERIPRHDEKFIKRYIFALYIQGIDEIVIKDKNINTRLLSKISEFVKQLIGMEIIDASNGKIVLKCLATTDFDVFGVINRMSQIIQGMISTIDECFESGDFEGLREIGSLEEDSDRLYLLAIRQEHRLVREYSSPSRWNELRLILGIRMVAKLLEEIADSFNDFSMYVLQMEDRTRANSLKSLISNLHKVFEMVSRAYMTSDIELTEDSIEFLEEMEEKILKRMEEDIYYRLALESILSACRHMKSICEVAFNKSVRESISSGLASKQ